MIDPKLQDLKEKAILRANDILERKHEHSDEEIANARHFLDSQYASVKFNTIDNEDDLQIFFNYLYTRSL